MSFVSSSDRLGHDKRAGPVTSERFDTASIVLFFIGLGLAAYEWTGGRQVILIDLCLIIALGLPHGALDVELARVKLGAKLGMWWFPAFALPYLGLSLAILAGWHAFPGASLALFLVLSTWHFGGEHTGVTSRMTMIILGAASIALPVVIHPAATAALLAGIMQVPLEACPAWLVTSSYLWIAAILPSLYSAQGDRKLPELALLVGLYALLSPLTALAIYFICVHAPTHMRAMISRRLSPRIINLQSAFLCALPATLLTVGIGILLWPAYNGPVMQRLLALTIQGLAALTVPHMLMDVTVNRLKTVRDA